MPRGRFQFIRRGLRAVRGFGWRRTLGRSDRLLWLRLRAFVRAQLYAFYGSDFHQLESVDDVTDEVFEFVQHLANIQQVALRIGLGSINRYSLRRTGTRFDRLAPARVIQLLNQGESSSPFPLIVWDGSLAQWLRHTIASSVAMISRMVICSRPEALREIGFQWSEPCKTRANLVPTSALTKPPYPDLGAVYDVCVIGSGAGGAVVAAAVSRAGHSVLMIESGDWVHPAELAETNPFEPDLAKNVWPPRANKALMRFFRGAGVNFAAELSMLPRNAAELAEIEAIEDSAIAAAFSPPQIVNVTQPEVVGGGPYVNNAIHLAMERVVWDQWVDFWKGEGKQPPCSYADLETRMNEVIDQLGVCTGPTQHCTGDDAMVFVKGCRASGEAVDPLPVSITEDPASCFGCGVDNVVDPFGKHTGGLHPYRAGGPNSYLMEAIQSGAKIAFKTEATRFHFTSSEDEVAFLGVRDARGSAAIDRTVRARAYVLAAGAIQSTKLLQSSIDRTDIVLHGLGERLTGNIGTPVFAVFDSPIRNSASGRPYPGIAQCFYVKRKTGRPDLENWFGVPGHLALGLAGWFKEFVDVMKKHNHLSICGMFVPTAVRSTNLVKPDGKVVLELDSSEFELILKGIENIGEIYFAAAGEMGNPATIYLPTRAVLLDESEQPLRIRTINQLRAALDRVRKAGPAILNLVTTHPQGGNPLGKVVDTDSFKVHGIENLFVTDASIFPAGCEINPQLALKALPVLGRTRYYRIYPQSTTVGRNAALAE